MRARFAGDLRAPASARSFVARQLDTIMDRGERLPREDVVLIVSELVTNSVRAGASTIDVLLHVAAERLELRVSDDADGWPRPREAGADALGGRGLAIVDRLADGWSATPLDPGKTVTATWFRDPS